MQSTGTSLHPTNGVTCSNCRRACRPVDIEILRDCPKSEDLQLTKKASRGMTWAWKSPLSSAKHLRRRSTGRIPQAPPPPPSTKTVTATGRSYRADGVRGDPLPEARTGQRTPSPRNGSARSRRMWSCRELDTAASDSTSARERDVTLRFQTLTTLPTAPPRRPQAEGEVSGGSSSVLSSERQLGRRIVRIVQDDQPPTLLDIIEPSSEQLQNVRLGIFPPVDLDSLRDISNALLESSCVARVNP